MSIMPPGLELTIMCGGGGWMVAYNAARLTREQLRRSAGRGSGNSTCDFSSLPRVL